METLEIQVYDTISTVDTLVNAEQYILEVVRKWYSENIDKPLNISIRRIKGRAPPELKINVNDAIAAKGGLV